MEGELPEAVDRIVDAVRGRAQGPRRDVIADFARAALRRVPHDQLSAARAEHVADHLVAAFAFLDGRRGDEVDVRSFVPEVAFDGWSEAGTVVQVCSPDRPFLLSTVTDELDLRGYEVVRSLHPIIGVVRADDGTVAEVLPARQAEHRDSFIHVELADTLDPQERSDLERTLERLLGDVLRATRDYQAMRARLEQVIAELDPGTLPFDEAEVAETSALLRWLLDDNFVFVGWREYAVTGQGDDAAVRALPDSGLGILADERASRYAEPVPLRDLDPQLRERFLRPELLTFSRTNRRSTVRRRTRLDYVGIRTFGPDGEVRGERRLLGLFTRKGIAEPARTTPVLRRKLAAILDREDVVGGSHDERVLISLFQALPKDELFQSDLDDLHRTLVGLLHAEEHQETRVLVRTDPFTRSVSVLVAVPRDRYSPELRRQLQALLRERYAVDRVDVDLSLGNRAEALARFSLQVEHEIPEVVVDDLQTEVRRLARSWIDDVSAALLRERGEVEAQRLLATVATRLPRGYRDRMPLERSLRDVEALHRLLASDGPLDVELGRGLPTDDPDVLRLTARKVGAPLELSAFLPMIESLGLRVVAEHPFELEDPGPRVTVHDYVVRPPGPLDLATDGPRLAEAVLAAWSGRAEADSLNRLVLHAGLPWRDVAVLRAYRRYRRQLGTAYTAEYVNDALVNHPEVARRLIALFAARFDPDASTAEGEVEEARDAVVRACDRVERLDHDRILRAFLELIDATTRTSHYRDDAVAEQADGRLVPYLALKLDSSLVPGMPQPVPYREIFVYAPTVEGVHLRGGPVARGGLRWSDRQDDVRTEVLGLMKAQMLKNAVIVPTGAKGGFVLKQPPDDPGELRAEVERQYVTFVRALLDVTDDVVDGTVTGPPRVVRHDGDDPYLVVAADRGTATFSDVANGIAEARGFWLGDAFASGGSNGYDHKALGITARGAWVAVRHHFQELGIDTQTEPIDVVGIGDMSGDVFGNGMLSSRTIRLVAAFDHRHVFLDPDPDPAAAYHERRRLFGLPRSSWADYDATLLSPGGGVFGRDRKSIPISAEVRAALRIEDEELSPPELIRAILRAPVDLLFAGGIGTYVKATHESHERIGDRANDELRVDATEVRARVIGEGANLAITQAARIQYARRGGRINMDAIDNAAGVDISDHEVNLKILLRGASERGAISRTDRDRLLADVTDEVVEHVLGDVERQVRRLSFEAMESPGAMTQYGQLLQLLEREHDLHRDVAGLPSAAEMDERHAAGAGLTRPELAVVLAHAKRMLTGELLDSPLPDQPSVLPILDTYFPGALVERFPDDIREHRLRRELVATLVANDVVDRLGITFAFRLATETGSRRHQVVAAYWTARTVAAADERWRAVDALSGTVPVERHRLLKHDVDRLVTTLTRVYLTGAADGMQATIERDLPLFRTLEQELDDLGTDAQRQQRLVRTQELLDDLVDPELAHFLAVSRDLAMVPDVAAVLAEQPGTRGGAAVADAFLRLGTALSLERLAGVLDDVDATERWRRSQRDGLASDLRQLRTDAVRAALREAPSVPEPEAIRQFLGRRRAPVERAAALVREVVADPDLDAVAVAARTIDHAIRAG